MSLCAVFIAVEIVVNCSHCCTVVKVASMLTLT